MATALSRVHQTLTDASCPEDVFGALGSTGEPPERELVSIFEQLASICNPDRFRDNTEQHLLALDAFKKLNAFRDQAAAKLSQGCYGDRGV